ncbi:Uu.00g095500.m01.CDS01 [Anthostomella pinea]|uniref:Uu.00g095500.m01.CDS01 n=1 Tax=Anthostomella pinea TaxID=933095 RepID=A0AAI8YER8_9PEZI|nr:Uu.00g095500.m01.CDS01 [Anthostomella pinea]
MATIRSCISGSDCNQEYGRHTTKATFTNQKVRSAVDTWTNNCTESPAPSPSHVDDEILTFAIHTNLDQEERPYFNALLSGTRELQSAFRAPTPLRKPRTDFIMMTGLQLQRLYRLSQTPRDAETAVYRVKHPLYHDILTTMMDIRPQEWEFLISGWCDGFLCPGADRDDAMTITADNPLSRGSLPGHGFFPPPPSREPMDPGMPRAPGFGASRSSKPYSQINSCGATPASFISLYSSSSTSPGHNQPPVSHDEEIEMVALAGIEQGIYQGMEALEDAFEKLHERAEMVRHALRQRNKGLLMSKQRRRLGKIDMLPQLSDTSAGNERPSWATGDDYKVMSESDWDEDDFDIAPEDSASNIPSSKYRRPKRQNQKNIPATIKEDDNEN